MSSRKAGIDTGSKALDRKRQEARRRVKPGPVTIRIADGSVKVVSQRSIRRAKS